MTDRKYTQLRVERGYCRNCGKRPVKEGCTACQHCLHQKGLTQQDTRQDRRERGLCPGCGRRPPRVGRWGCRKCLDAHRRRTEAYRQRHRQSQEYLHKR